MLSLEFKEKRLHYFLALLFVVFVLLRVPTLQADTPWDNTEVLSPLASNRITMAMQKMSAAADVGNQKLVIETLSRIIIDTNSLAENDYIEVSANVSLILRKTNQTAATKAVAEFLVSEDASFMKLAPRYRWMMKISYDLMFFTEFSSLKRMLDVELDTIKKWTPITDDSRTVQANLYHIYGQLLVRQQRVAEALPYFYQAEAWFKAVDDNHPSIFVIQVILGEAFLQAKDYQRAEQFIRLALNMVPEGRVDAISYLYAILASALERQQRPVEALDAIETYLANPVDPRRDYFLYFSLIHIEVLRHLQEFDLALELAKSTHALATEVGNEDYLKDATRHLGFLYAYFNQLDKAERLLKEAIESPSHIREGNPPQAYLDYVEVLTKLGKHQSALGYYARYHSAFVEESQRINQTEIANLAFQQENQRLSQQQALSEAQLALAKANENRAHLHTRVLTWAAATLVIIVTIISVMLFQLRRKSIQLHQMAVEDQLTKLGNRHAFLHALKKPNYTALIIADIDGLKFYNDNYGHQKGDELIKSYANQMQQVLSRADAELFRIGGDEFAILFHHTVPHAIVDEWMKDALTRTQQTGFARVGASYGIATRDEIRNDQELISLADQRMYTMKEANRPTTNTVR